MTVFRFIPETANLENIPHMLRHLASAIENGDHGDVDALLVVLPPESGEWPTCFGFGHDDLLTDVHAVGMLEMAKAKFCNMITERM
jgi:hypothetical protein